MCGPAFLVLEQDQQLIGFTTFLSFWLGPVVRAHGSIRLFLRLRRKACARELLILALKTEARRGAVHSLWASVSSVKTGGVQFHEKINFQFAACLPEVGFKFDRWLNLILMQKIL